MELGGARLNRQRELTQLQERLHNVTGSAKTSSDKRAGGTSGGQTNAVTSQGDGMGAGDAIAEGIEQEGAAQTTDSTSGLDERVLPVLRGSLEDLPALPSRIVRIFISSTFTGKAQCHSLFVLSQSVGYPFSQCLPLPFFLCILYTHIIIVVDP